MILLDDEREVALKVCHQQIDPETILREFRILRELRHPGIARAIDFGRLPETGQTYFTMEHVPGPDLEKEASRLRQQNGQGDLTALLLVFLQVTRALDYLHRKGLLHLDLKPSNVVFADDQVKLIDFGLVQNAGGQNTRPTRGTAHYVSPEVIDCGTVDSRADLYSLGVTMYRALTGTYPITRPHSDGDLRPSPQDPAAVSTRTSRRAFARHPQATGQGSATPVPECRPGRRRPRSSLPVAQPTSSAPSGPRTRTLSDANANSMGSSHG